MKTGCISIKKINQEKIFRVVQICIALIYYCPGSVIYFIHIYIRPSIYMFPER